MKKFFLLTFIIIVGLGVLGLLSNKNQKVVPLPEVSKTVTIDSFTYNGVAGKDALSLLKEKARVSESQPGFVTSINGRKAEQSKKEYWAFFVNGKMSGVGAADYQTKQGDLLEWKIINY